MSFCTSCPNTPVLDLPSCSRVPASALSATASTPAPQFDAYLVPNVTDGRRIVTDQDVTRQSAMAAMGQALDVNKISELTWTKGGSWVGPDGKRMFPSFPVIIPTPINQYHCGSCWACATAVALGSRYAVALQEEKYQTLKPLMPSVANLVSCSQVLTMSSDGTTLTFNICPGGEYTQCPDATCSVGGNVQIAATWLAGNYEGSDGTNWIGSEKCWPYTQYFHLPGNATPTDGVVNPAGAPSVNNPPNCMGNLKNCCFDCCDTDGTSANKEYSIKFSVLPGSVLPYSLQASGSLEDIITAIKQDIYQHGPLCAQFRVPANFSHWFINRKSPSEVYDPAQRLPPNALADPTQWTGGHAVVIVGWGKFAGGEFWEVQNSWGNTFAGGGFYRVAMSKKDDMGRWLGMDAPINMGGQLWGGAVSFLPNIISHRMKHSVEDISKKRKKPGIWNRQINTLIREGYIRKADSDENDLKHIVDVKSKLLNSLSVMAGERQPPPRLKQIANLIKAMADELPREAAKMAIEVVKSTPNIPNATSIITAAETAVEAPQTNLPKKKANDADAKSATPRLIRWLGVAVVVVACYFFIRHLFAAAPENSYSTG